MITFWLIISLLFLIIELMWVGFFYCLSFAAGFVVAGLSSLLGFSLIAQCFVGLGASLSFFLVLHVLLKKHFLFLPRHTTKTNVYTLIGKKGTVICPISFLHMGQVNIEGQLWAARSGEKNGIPCDVHVEVVGIKGCHVIVKKLETKIEL